MVRKTYHTRTARALLFPIVALVFFASTVANVQAQSCNQPLFVEQYGAQANVLFIFDSSGSMSTVIYHEDYDGRTNYPGGLDSTTVYKVTSDGTYSAADFESGEPVIPTADLVTSENGNSSRYPGNYLNWIFYHATDTQRATLPMTTRVEVAKIVLDGIVTDVLDPIRWGVMKFNGEDGGDLVADVGTDESTLISLVNGINAGGYTPLAETLVSALEYLDDDGAGAPIEYECQKCFVIMMTDGYPTRDLTMPGYIDDWDGDGNEPGTCESIGAEEPNSADCSDWLDDVAGYLYETDLRTDLDGQQNAITYTIGFGIDMPLLQQAADNGGGLYFVANNADQLQSSLANILSDIVAKVSSGTAVSVVSAESASDNRVYRASFKPGSWQGFLQAFDLPYQPDDLAVWEAGEILQSRNADSRTIYTSLSGSLVDFDLSNESSLRSHLNTSDADTSTDIINYIHGNDVAGYRDRSGWKLGDVVDSSPVVVGKPAYFYAFNDYRTFLNNNASRQSVIYMGANDGMLHCFRASDGYEMWSYIPNNQLGKLRTLMDDDYCHQYFVNLSPTVVDAYVGGQWRTILLGGEKEGGNGLFALDVTDPSNPDFLWEITLPSGDESWSKPEVARVENLDKFVAFVGSGLDRTTGEAHLFALDLEDGSTIWSDHLSTASGMNHVSTPVKVDTDFDGYHDLLYVTDLEGTLWRVDLGASPWDVDAIFDTDQPIQAEPIITSDGLGNIMLYFGTGQYIESSDVTDTSQQTFYCIIDNNSSTPISKSDLVDQTYSISPVTATDRGWFIDLVQTPGERITRPDALAAGTVYFTSFAPTTETCSAGGRSWLYTVDFADGSSADNDDGTENDTTSGRVEDLGDGIHSEPIIDLANEDIILQSTDTNMLVKDTRGIIRRVVVRAWRQIYQ